MFFLVLSHYTHLPDSSYKCWLCCCCQHQWVKETLSYSRSVSLSLSIRCAKTTRTLIWSSLCSLVDSLTHSQFAVQKQQQQQTSTEVRSVFSPTLNSLSALNFTFVWLCVCVCVSPSTLLLLNLAPASLSLSLSRSLHSAKNSCRKLFIISICKGGKGKETERETWNERKSDIVCAVNKRWERVNVFALAQCMSNCRLAAQTVRNTLEIYYSHNVNSFSCESFIQPAS